MPNGTNGGNGTPVLVDHIEIERWTKHQTPNQKELDEINALRLLLVPDAQAITGEELTELMSGPQQVTHLVVARKRTETEQQIVGMGIVHIIPFITTGKTGRVADLVACEEYSKNGVLEMIQKELRTIAHEFQVQTFVPGKTILPRSAEVTGDSFL